jgi:hypothetical protein
MVVGVNHSSHQQHHTTPSATTANQQLHNSTTTTTTIASPITTTTTTTAAVAPTTTTTTAAAVTGTHHKPHTVHDIANGPSCIETATGVSQRQYDYVNESSILDDLICTICRAPFIEPVRTQCAHNFCRECISAFLQRSPRNTCPSCDQHLSMADLADEKMPIIVHQLNNLVIRCPHHGVGCKWSGARSTQNSHLKHCQFFRCLHHATGCRWKGTQTALNKHLIECDFADIRCKYSAHGCHVQEPRRSISKHEQICTIGATMRVQQSTKALEGIRQQEAIRQRQSQSVHEVEQVRHQQRIELEKKKRALEQQIARDKSDILHSKAALIKGAQVVKLNVSGKIISTTKSTLCSDASSVLAMIFADDTHQHKNNNAVRDETPLFLDCNIQAFEKVLDWMRRYRHWLVSLKSITMHGHDCLVGGCSWCVCVCDCV